MPKKAALFAAAALLAVGLVPTVSSADHSPDCSQLFVFSGQPLPQNPASGGLINLGGYTCTVSNLNAATHVNAPLTPGATHLRVGATSYPQNDDFKPTSSTVQFNNSTPKAITWEWDKSNNRWISQPFTIPAGTTKVTAKATLQPRDWPDKPARAYKVVYHKVA